MSVEFSPRAALCTAAVLGGLAMLATAQLPFAFLGFGDTPREGLLKMAGGSTRQGDVERDIVGAVLMHEARRPGRSNVCLRLSDHGRTFEREKRAMRALGQRLKREPGARAQLTSDLDRLTAPQRTWLAPSHGSGSQIALPLESAVSLRTTEHDLLAAPPTSAVEIELDGSAVPEAFRSVGPGCTTMFFSAPALAGEIAFVETSLHCGAGCGEEWLYAAALRDERWMVVGVARP